MNRRRRLRVWSLFFRLLRWLSDRLPGRPGSDAIDGRLARNGVLGAEQPVPLRWGDAIDPEPIFIPHPKTNRAMLVGVVAGRWPERSYRRAIYAGRGHLLRRPPAICADVDALKQAETYGACWFEAWDPERLRLYRCQLSEFKRKGHFIEVERGHGVQRGVLMTWVKVHTKEATL